LNASFSAEAGEDVAFWFFAVGMEHMFPLFTAAEISLLQNVIEGLKTVRRYSGTTPLARECHRMLTETPAGFDLDHRSQLLRVAASILAAEFKGVHAHRAGLARSDEHVMQVFEQLSTHELLNLSVADLAAKFSCSKRHLNRLFHQHFGFSVAAMRMEMRLLKAISLLRDPYAKVINVAEQCGFNHLGLFNTCFKRRFGISPGQWRKQASDAAGASNRNTLLCPLRTNNLCPWAGCEDGAPADRSAPNTNPPPTALPGRILVSMKGLADPNSSAKSAGHPVLKVIVEPGPACPKRRGADAQPNA
jgi:AraC-like DNA-binding protein